MWPVSSKKLSRQEDPPGCSSGGRQICSGRMDVVWDSHGSHGANEGATKMCGLSHIPPASARRKQELRIAFVEIIIYSN